MEPEPPLLELAVITACLLGSAFFSSAETALTSVSEAKLKQLHESGKSGSSAIGLWLNSPSEALTTILIANNLVNIITASLFTKLAQSYYDEQALPIAVAVSTTLVIIFGEIIPKTFARYNKEWMVIPYMVILKAFYFMFYPATMLLTPLSNWAIQMMGGNSEENRAITEDELEYMIKLSSERGGVVKEKTEMLESIFDLDDITVKEIMVPRTSMVTARIDWDFDQFLKIFSEGKHSRVPVYSENLDKLEGLLFARDLLAHIEQKGKKGFNVKSYLRKPLYAPYSEKIDSLLKKMQAEKTHMAIVVDEFGGTAGLVTIEDILEEIVGEIFDEFEEGDDLIEHHDGFTIVKANINLRDLEDRFEGLEFPEDGDYDTLAGFIIDVNGSLPEKGFLAKHSGFRLEVNDADETKVISVKCSKIENDEEEADPDKKNTLEEDPQTPERKANIA